MLKRREFLKHSAFVATAASTGILTAQASGAPQAAPKHPIHFVIVDETFEDSVAFANTLIAQGARAFSVQEDLGRLWFGELGTLFRPGHALAGLTAHTDLMICAAFARQHGARVCFEGSHDCRGSEELTHSLRIGAAELPISAALTAAGREWPAVLAARMTELSKCDALREDCCRTTTRRSETHPGSLFSWVVA